MSDHDLQDKSDQKAAVKNSQNQNVPNIVFSQNNVVNFDEVGKDSKSSPPQAKAKEYIPEPPTHIDFFGVQQNDNNNNNDNDRYNNDEDNEENDQIDLDQLEKDFGGDNNRENPFGQSITRELL